MVSSGIIPTWRVFAHIFNVGHHFDNAMASDLEIEHVNKSKSATHRCLHARILCCGRWHRSLRLVRVRSQFRYL